jgi:pyruvate/2-oxoglutarate dehydrogenase complex dihydrolipoamide acyltransferase (E2) component
MAESRLPNPLVDQFRRGGVPHDLRLMAAQGALPLKPEDLVDLLLHLTRDAEEAVRQAAGATLSATPGETMLPLTKDRQTPANVLAWVLANRPEKELREAVLQNTSTTDEAIESLVAGLPADLAELVVINQVRLLRRTTLLEALESNPNLNSDQRRRLRELRESFHIGEAAAVAPPPAAAPAEAAPAPPAEPAAPEEPPPSTEDEAVRRYLTEEEQGEEQKVNAVQRIFRLNTAHKVILALKGTREERTVLIRDPNRIVATAVLGSPRLTDAEVESIAAMRNVQDEILRVVGTHKEWTKRYSVISNLVKNPRTPLAVSLQLVSRLNPRDMKSLAQDRNVSEVVRRQAQRFVRQGHER